MQMYEHGANYTSTGALSNLTLFIFEGPSPAYQLLSARQHVANLWSFSSLAMVQSISWITFDHQLQMRLGGTTAAHSYCSTW